MSTSRQQIRQLIRQKRQSLTPEFQQEAASRLVSVIKENRFAVELKHKKVALYLSNDGELDVTEAIKLCWQQSAEVYLPVLHPFAKGHLLFLRYQENDKLQNNKYGICEPVLDVRNICPVAELDIAFTPLVAFDLAGNRLGMGGGYYDRTFNFLTKTKKSHKTQLIGLAHECQKVDKLPIETWDVPLKQIITPVNNYLF
ncbi:5-formyltetrahydrofolate cyclo-ligase [Catenovulum sp. SM1970]|uniref:5-formyltetrahydrofolate cyclo-ligase n=1 Tax=Marinifaba aquimaris TaxID=2741323 RepID=UPI00157421B1|nr:5-formyltetrahydrofolate cyclo-ligase [Marinifaba aquimaris]NTS77168.1 5-formyltetrahydrofolate cyclo-ligase [Marinifaba aquimaris]